LLHGATGRIGKLIVVCGALAAFCVTAIGCEGEAQKAAIRQRIGGTVAEGHSLPSHEDYYGSAVADKDHAWVVGTYGTILSITDGATKVALQKSGTQYSLFSVSCADANNCVVGGERGLILRTTDGGKTWDKVSAPAGLSENLLSMSRGKDPNNIWAVGPVATVIHSADGGKTWEDQSLHKDECLNSVVFLDDRDGWVQGEFGVIKHTTDGGKTWVESDKVVGLPKYVEDVTDEQAYHRGIPKLSEQDLYLFGSAWTSPQKGYIVAASGYVLETVDGGATWEAKRGGSNSLFTIGAAPGHSPVAAGLLGTVVHEGSDGNWTLDQAVSTHVYTWLRSEAFSPDGSLGIMTGGSGTVLVSHDGGATWKEFSKDIIAAAGITAAKS
jgi:photosystem II stability/assembly factor-like uncharacterized protein